jgi:hypothetical protein
MGHTEFAFAIVLMALSSVACATQAAPETPAQALSRILDASRMPLAMSDYGLSGPGARKIIDDARHAQFVLVGEDHGFTDVPQFVVALKRSLGADAPPNLVLEIGPLTAAHLADAARTDAIGKLVHQYPAALSFFDWVDDGDMAKAWQGHGAGTVLWGIDQEFIIATRMHFERLKALNAHATASSRGLVDGYLQRAQVADIKLVAEHDPEATLLPQLQADDFDRLRAALKPKPGSESANILDELEQSAGIYRTQGTHGYDSNHARSLLMKRHFMGYYDAAAARSDAPPRAMFRLGALHAGRGLSGANQFDIGNLASELAASHGQPSLHVLVIAAGGSVNQWRPFLAAASLHSTPYKAKEELAQLQADSFIDHTLPDAWTVFDMGLLRRSRAAREAGGPVFTNLVFAYDYVVVIPKAHAAIEYPAQ